MEAAARPGFGAWLRRYRLDAGLTQRELAERANLSVEAIGLLEREGRTRPQRETVELLVRALALSPARESLLRGALGVARPPRRHEREGSSDVLTLSFLRADSEAARRHNIPQQRTSFIGRQHELAAIATLLERYRLVTLVGAGGVGKTRAALQLAADTLDAYPDGVFFADLAPLADEALVASAVLIALQVTSTTESPPEAVVSYLKSRRLLLVLDNCEHVLGQARDLAAQIAQSCPSVHVLSTSREPLNLVDEHPFLLPSLTIPPDSCRSASEALTYNTVELFVDRARSVDTTFLLTDQNTVHVAEICRRLDGIPLAIELAAARIGMLSPRQIAERLDRRFRLLTRGNPRALPRHQTMEALIGWSYDLLTPRERRFFERLAVFAGGCSLDAATAVCAENDEDDLDVIDLIESLVTKSLLVAELVGDEQRYRLLESTRQYALNKLIAHGEQDVVAQRHALTYLEGAQRLESASDSTSEQIWASQVKVELENWRAALDWALGRRRDVALGMRLAAMRKVIWRSFSPVEGRRWVRSALDSIDQNTPLDLVARLVHAAAEGANQFGEREVSLAAAERALVRYRELGDALGIAQTQSLVGGSLVLLGRLAEAEPLLREALEVAGTLGDRRLAAKVLQMIGCARTAVGDFAGARAYLMEALALAKALDAEFIAASVSATLAENEFHAGDSEEALRLTLDLLANLRELNSAPTVPGIAATLTNIATYLIALGRYDEARVHTNEALEIARGLRLGPLALLSLRLLALAAALKTPTENIGTPAAYASAGRLFGFLDAHLSTFGPQEYGLQREYEDALSTLGRAIGTEDLRHLLVVGAAMSEDEAFEQAHALQ